MTTKLNLTIIIHSGSMITVLKVPVPLLITLTFWNFFKKLQVLKNILELDTCIVNIITYSVNFTIFYNMLYTII